MITSLLYLSSAVEPSRESGRGHRGEFRQIHYHPVPYPPPGTCNSRYRLSERTPFTDGAPSVRHSGDAERYGHRGGDHGYYRSTDRRRQRPDQARLDPRACPRGPRFGDAQLLLARAVCRLYRQRPVQLRQGRHPAQRHHQGGAPARTRRLILRPARHAPAHLQGKPRAACRRVGQTVRELRLRHDLARAAAGRHLQRGRRR